jgi:hypothetical protein
MEARAIREKTVCISEIERKEVNKQIEKLAN